MLNQQLLPSQEIKDGIMEEEEVEGDRTIIIVGQEVCCQLSVQTSYYTNSHVVRHYFDYKCITAVLHWKKIVFRHILLRLNQLLIFKNYN